MLIRISRTILGRDVRPPRMMGSLLGLALLLVLKPGVASKSPVAVAEHELKAVYLERITRFIEWPADHEINSSATRFVVGVIGVDPFGGALTSIFSRQQIKGKPVEVRRIRNPGDLAAVAATHLLFIGKLDESYLPKILTTARDRSVLTVSDTPGFGDLGVMVNFFAAGEHLRFEINPAPVRRAGLDMSYVLLRSARIVGESH